MLQMMYFPLSRENVKVELGTAISVSVRSSLLFFVMDSALYDFFAWIELKHVESDLPINTVVVCLSIYLSVLKDLNSSVAKRGQCLLD